MNCTQRDECFSGTALGNDSSRSGLFPTLDDPHDGQFLGGEGLAQKLLDGGRGWISRLMQGGVHSNNPFSHFLGETTQVIASVLRQGHSSFLWPIELVTKWGLIC